MQQLRAASASSFHVIDIRLLQTFSLDNACAFEDGRALSFQHQDSTKAMNFQESSSRIAIVQFDNTKLIKMSISKYIPTKGVEEQLCLKQ